MSWHLSIPMIEEIARVCENSHCSRGRAGESLEQCSWDSKSCAELRLIRTAEKSCFGVRKKAFLKPSPSGMTSEPSLEGLGVARWMLSLAASRASRSAPLGSNLGKTIPATCGPKPSESFAKWDRDSACWKTYQLSLLTNTLVPFSGSFPKAGIACGGRLYRLPNLERRIGEIEFGLWPTANAAGGTGYMSGSKRDTWRPTLQSSVQISPTGEPPQIHAGKMWPTPVRANAERGGRGDLLAWVRGYPNKHYPTPSARDWKSSNASPETMNRKARPLNEMVTGGHGGALNPPWVEWLMGWPVGWTDLKPLGTDRFRQWCEQHGICSREKPE